MCVPTNCRSAASLAEYLWIGRNKWRPTKRRDRVHIVADWLLQNGARESLIYIRIYVSGSSSAQSRRAISSACVASRSLLECILDDASTLLHYEPRGSSRTQYCKQLRPYCTCYHSDAQPARIVSQSSSKVFLSNNAQRNAATYCGHDVHIAHLVCRVFSFIVRKIQAKCT